MFMKRLKEETRGYHDALEANPLLSHMMSDQVSRAHYCGVLERFYGYYLPLESALEQIGDIDDLELNFNQRRKAIALASDLRALGYAQAKIEQLPCCEQLPALESLPAALGALYVTEGATLGGQLIRRHLKRKLSIDEDSGCAFFASYGDKVGPMWQDFRALVERYAGDHSAEDEIVAAVVETYATFDAWLSASPLIAAMR